MRKNAIRRVLCRELYERVSRIEAYTRKCFSKAPLIDAPIADDAEYVKRFDAAWNAGRSVDLDLAFEVDDEWFRRVAFLTQATIKASSLSFDHGRLLFSELYVKALEHRGELLKVLEIGTARGFSAICMAKALYVAKARGIVLTIDPIPNDKAIYWNGPGDQLGKRSRRELLSEFKELVDEYILFVEGTSDQILPRMGIGRVHFAFIDGMHEHKAVLRELEFAASKQRPGDVIVLDDFNETDFPDVIRATDVFCGTYEYSRRIFGEGPRRYVKLTRKSA